MSDAHPTERVLARLVDDRLDSAQAEETRRHLDQCVRCASRVARLQPATTTVLPAARLESIPVRFAEDRDVEPSKGEIWRLSWGETEQLAVVWVGGSLPYTVLPLIDSSLAGDGCVIFPNEESGLGDVAVWMSARTDVPAVVMDARVGRLKSIVALTRHDEADRADLSLQTSGVEIGAPIRPELDARSDAMEIVRDEFRILSEAAWVPEATETQAVTLDFDSLINAQLPTNRALAIVRGASPTPAERNLIAASTGVTIGDAPVSLEVIRELERPTRKSRIRDRARRHNRDEGAERRELARQVEPALMAARGTEGRPPEPSRLLDALLDE